MNYLIVGRRFGEQEGEENLCMRKQLLFFFEGRNSNGMLVREKEGWFYMGEFI